MRIPESFEGLLPNTVVSSRVHQQHAEEHDMSGNTTGLSVVDLDRCRRPDLCFFHVVEAAPS